MTLKEFFKLVESLRPNNGVIDASVLGSAGFPSVTIGRQHSLLWSKVHDWCREYYGPGNYTWTGEIFWFNTEEDAVVFALKYGD